MCRATPGLGLWSGVAKFLDDAPPALKKTLSGGPGGGGGGGRDTDKLVFHYGVGVLSSSKYMADLSDDKQKKERKIIEGDCPATPPPPRNAASDYVNMYVCVYVVMCHSSALLFTILQC